MKQNGETVIRLSPATAEISVEQYEGGVVSYKTVSPESLINCFLESRIQSEVYPSGFLPEYCIAVNVGKGNRWYFVCCPQRFENISYFGKAYEHFPLPRLVFGFCRETDTGAVCQARLCVVSEGRLSNDAPTFHYPFSNLYGEGRICIGRNTLPIYKDPSRLHTLAGHTVSHSMIWGIALAVITCPANRDQQVQRPCWISMMTFKYLVDDLWGKEQQVRQMVEMLPFTT